jgi:hypothetical protein
MGKNKKIKKTKKIAEPENKNSKKEIGKEKVDIDEEEKEKEGGALSDGVLDAFEEVAPVDPLLEIEEEDTLAEEDDDDEFDSGDYKPSDEW